MGSWANDIPLTFVIPAGAVSGERIVLNGITGQIQVYAVDNSLVGQIDANGVEYLNANGAYVRLFEGTLGGVITPHFDGAMVAMLPPALPGSNYAPGVYNVASFLSGGRNYGEVFIMSPFDQQYAATISVPRISMNDDAGVGTGGQILITMEGSNAAGSLTIDTNVILEGSFGGTATFNMDLMMGVHNGLQANIFAQDPSVFGVNESWHAATKVNGWTNRAGSAPLRYRLIASPAKSFQLNGSANAGTKADGTTITTLPVAYWPSNGIDVPVACDTLSTQSPHFNVSTSGVVTCWGLSAASFFSVNSIIPLD